jgi:hypothetical protein
MRRVILGSLLEFATTSFGSELHEPVDELHEPVDELHEPVDELPRVERPRAQAVSSPASVASTVVLRRRSARQAQRAVELESSSA